VKGIEITDIDIPTVKELPVVLFNNTTEIVMKNLKMPVSEEKGVMKASYK
jgi:hypothetical protein